jgi:hypothetical protein
MAEGPREGLSFAELERNIDEVCRSLSNRLQGMDMNGKMSLCRDLIDKVVVENGNVEIHYKFPVSSNSNTRREHPEILMPACRIGAPDTSDALPVVAADEKACRNARGSSRCGSCRAPSRNAHRSPPRSWRSGLGTQAAGCWCPAGRSLPVVRQRVLPPPPLPVPTDPAILKTRDSHEGSIDAPRRWT